MGNSSANIYKYSTLQTPSIREFEVDMMAFCQVGGHIPDPLKVMGRKSGETFQNRKVTAYFENSKIRLDIDYSANTESFLEMHQKRKPSKTSLISNDLLTNGFTLANLGISISLEVSSPKGNRFAVFTRRGADKKCLALISGYWDVSLDVTCEDCAKREIQEEFLVFRQSENKFIVPKGMRFPYKDKQFTPSTCWTLTPNIKAIRWVPSAKIKITDRDSCRIYIDATTSSAQIVYGYYASFSDWQGLSIFHAEDRPDENNNLITYLEDQTIVLFQIGDNRLVSPGYYLKKGQLIPAELPDDSYFHPSMVGVNTYGIVSLDKIPLKDVIF